MRDWDGPGVRDVEADIVLICENCEYDDYTTALIASGVASGECPRCGVEYEIDLGEEW